MGKSVIQLQGNYPVDSILAANRAECRHEQKQNLHHGAPVPDEPGSNEMGNLKVAVARRIVKTAGRQAMVE